jgi:hypothetical protein
MHSFLLLLASLDPRFRVELTMAQILHHPVVPRDGDSLFHTLGEYEIKIAPRFTMGFRLYPLILYQHGENPVVYALAPGVSHRYFFDDPLARTGFFTQLEAALLFQSRNFVGNSSKNCFLTSFGVGHQFQKPDFSAALKVQHLSNANLSNENKGINGIAITLSTTFY